MRLGHDFDRLIAYCAPDHDRPIALGVSGGSDSRALLTLVAAWAKSRSRPVIVLSVDHGLRPQSIQEAAQVKDWANRLGCFHETLVWNKPESRQAAARQARHRLLAAGAHRHDANVLLLAHTLDDVTETMMMRARRNQRDACIAGPSMCSPSPVWPQGRNMIIVRPLLLVKRADLKRMLKANAMAWIDDPSNHDRIYERTRIRQFLQRHPRWREHLQAMAISRLSQRTRMQQVLGARLASPATVSVDTQGLIGLTASGQDAALLAVLIRVAGGHDRPPRASAVSRLIAALHRTGNRHTLAGTWIEKTPTGYALGRDPGLPVKNEPGLWDGRYVRDDKGTFRHAHVPVLLRANAPPGRGWREIMSERIAHEAHCYQAPPLQPACS